MSNYDLVFEALQSKLDNGTITLEEAELLNDIAFDVDNELTTEGAYKRHVENMNKNYDAQKKDLESLKAKLETSKGNVKKQIEDSIKRKEAQMKAETEQLHKQGVVNSDEYEERQKHAKVLGEGHRTARKIEKGVANTAKGNSPLAIGKRAVAGVKGYGSKEYKDAQQKIYDNHKEYFDQLNDKKKFNAEHEGPTRKSPDEKPVSKYKEANVAPPIPKRKLIDRATVKHRVNKANPGYKDTQKKIHEKLAERNAKLKDIDDKQNELLNKYATPELKEQMSKPSKNTVRKESVNDSKLNVINANTIGEITFEERTEIIHILDGLLINE